MRNAAIEYINDNDEIALYSQIIDAESYDRIISKEHLYIAAADTYLVDIIKKKIHQFNLPEVVEIGSGTGRLLGQVRKIENICLTGVERDSNFIKYSQRVLKDLSVRIKTANILTYNHPAKVSIFYSQGVHHHIQKGDETIKYLKNVHKQLDVGGYYIVSDEYIPDYENEYDRSVLLVVWYSHIISHALKSGYDYLAEEEAKTLLDDLQEGTKEFSYKTKEQIKVILSKVDAINSFAESHNLITAKKLAELLISELRSKGTSFSSGDNALDLSRKDYKVCDKIFRAEVQKAGFEVEFNKSYGPIKSIGGMTVYVLRKI
jgi:SAM-dependent methyltransferase